MYTYTNQLCLLHRVNPPFLQGIVFSCEKYEKNRFFEARTRDYILNLNE